jgi:hypothetical protein
MARFMLVYESDAQAEDLMAQATPEEMQASMAEWLAWRDRVGGDEVLEFGLPLQPRVHVADGQATTSTSHASGYSILTVDSLDDAVRLVSDHPHLKRAGSSIEVHELLPMPGM